MDYSFLSLLILNTWVSIIKSDYMQSSHRHEEWHVSSTDIQVSKGIVEKKGIYFFGYSRPRCVYSGTFNSFLISRLG